MTLKQRHEARSRRQPRLLLLAAAVSGTLVVAGCSPGHEVAVTPAPPASDTPPAPTATETPPHVDQPATEALPAPPQAATTLPASAPVRLQVPAIGVDSDLIDLGLQADGTLEVPSDGFPAGWYTGAPTPGELGPAIIAGHVDWGGEPGVFFDLRHLTTGDAITVTRQDGSTARFRVTRIERYDKDSFPTETVYGDLDHAGLRLITCDGIFDPHERSYDDNLVVFAELV